MLTGTRLVRLKGGNRIGWGKAGWAMLARVCFMPVIFLTLFDSGPMADISPVRTSIDDPATQRLWAAGITFIH